MPTILRTQGFRLYFFSREPNEPAHIHIDHGDCTAKVWLQPIGIARTQGFRPKDIARLLAVVRDNQDALLEAWHGYFGTERG